MSKETVFLVVTSAFVLSGEIAEMGEIVEVTDTEARDFLRRGMARVATADDGIPDDEPEAETDVDDDTDADGNAPKLTKSQEKAAAKLAADSK